MGHIKYFIAINVGFDDRYDIMYSSQSFPVFFFFNFNPITHKMHTELFRNPVVNFEKLDLSLNQTAENNS